MAIAAGAPGLLAGQSAAYRKGCGCACSPWSCCQATYILNKSHDCFGAQRGSSNAHTCPHKHRHCHHCDVMLMLPLSRRTLSQRAQSAPSRKSICKASAGKGKLTTDIYFNPLKEVRELFDGKLTIRERPEPWSRNR